MEFYFYSLFLFFLIDILMYRIKKINFFIDCIIISFPLFVIIQYFLLGYLKVDLNTKILLFSNYIFFLIPILLANFTLVDPRNLSSKSLLVFIFSFLKKFFALITSPNSLIDKDEVLTGPNIFLSKLT